jgi:hypothetical protein
MSTINPLPNISLATPAALAPTTSAPTRQPDAAGTSAVRPERPAAPAAGTVRRPVASPVPAGARTLSAEPPTGVDPQLWSVLTTEERAHFAKLSAMGPLTYGRSAMAFRVADAPPPATRGARLDVRA